MASVPHISSYQYEIQHRCKNSLFGWNCLPRGYTNCQTARDSETQNANKARLNLQLWALFHTACRQQDHKIQFIYQNRNIYAFHTFFILIYGTVSAEHRVGSLEEPIEVSFFEPHFSSLQLKGDFFIFILVQIHIIIYLRNKIT